MLIDMYIKEFVSLTTNIIYKNNCVVNNNYIIVDTELLYTMLSKYDYENIEKKLHTWKSLKWIDTDYKRFTKKAVDPNTKERKRKIFIDKRVYETLKKLT